jgi:hypothetical protein
MRADRCFAPRAVPSAFARFRFPPEVITLAVRWYLRFGLSYRDVEELLAERGIKVDHVSILNHPGFGRDSLLGSGDQTDQVAQLVQGLELHRWPALAGSVQSTVVIPIHPCRGGNVDFSYWL